MSAPALQLICLSPFCRNRLLGFHPGWWNHSFVHPARTLVATLYMANICEDGQAAVPGGRGRHWVFDSCWRSLWAVVPSAM